MSCLKQGGRVAVCGAISVCEYSSARCKQYYYRIYSTCSLQVEYIRYSTCGQDIFDLLIADNDGKPEPDKLHITNMIYNRQRIEGFVCSPWLSGERGNFLRDMSEWVAAGKVQVAETTFEGVGQYGRAFQALFTGGNTGKVVVRVHGESWTARL